MAHPAFFFLPDLLGFAPNSAYAVSLEEHVGTTVKMSVFAF